MVNIVMVSNMAKYMTSWSIQCDQIEDYTIKAYVYTACNICISIVYHKVFLSVNLYCVCQSLSSKPVFYPLKSVAVYTSILSFQCRVENRSIHTYTLQLCNVNHLYPTFNVKFTSSFVAFNSSFSSAHSCSFAAFSC